MTILSSSKISAAGVRAAVRDQMVKSVKHLHRIDGVHQPRHSEISPVTLKAEIEPLLHLRKTISSWRK